MPIEKKRIEKLQDKVKNHAILLNDPNIFYFTGIQYFAGALIIPKKSEPFILSSAMDAERAHLSGIETITFSKDTPADIRANFRIALKKILDERKVRSVVSDSRFPKAKNISKEILQLRSVKDAKEIKLITKAAKIAMAGIREAEKRVHQKITEKQLAAEIEYAMRRVGGDGSSFSSIVASDRKSSQPHSFPEDRTIKDLVKIDIGSKYKGYCSDVTRTFLINEDSEVRRVYDMVRASHDAAVAEAKEGAACKELDEIARNVLGDLSENFIHSLGHGIGIEVHEEPSVYGGSKVKLKENTVITIEPGVYFSGKYGIRWENMILIKKNRAIILTK